MAYRYCSECDKWLETAEYTVDKTGETVCPKDGHKAVHGFIDNHVTTVETFNREHKFGDYSDEREAALRQNLIN